jgi:hypothetical protein
MMVGCSLRAVWEDIRDATIRLVGGVTFADLAARAGGPWVDPSLPVSAGRRRGDGGSLPGQPCETRL